MLVQTENFLLQAGAMLGDAFLHQLPHAFGMIQIGWYFNFFKFKMASLIPYLLTFVYDIVFFFSSCY